MRIPGKIVSGPHVGKTMIEAMREQRASADAAQKRADRIAYWLVCGEALCKQREAEERLREQRDNIVQIVPDEPKTIRERIAAHLSGRW